MKQYLEIGKAVSTHGLRGEVNLDPWSDSPTFLKQFQRLYLGAEYREVKVFQARPHKNQVILKLEGIDSIEAARNLVGSTFYIDRNDVTLPEGCYFQQDLIGLTVMDDETGQVYGRLVEVFQTPANEVYTIESPEGKQTCIPVLKDVIRSVDLASGKMLIHPLKGLFDHED